MKTRGMFSLLPIAVTALVGLFAWNKLSRAGYESAEYKVVTSDGKFEVREYPDLMLVATSTKMEAQGRDGSFMKLFRYISGANESDKKISLATYKDIDFEGRWKVNEVEAGHSHDRLANR